MNAIFLLTVLSLALPIYGEEAQEEKRQDKRGVLGLGYGGHGGGLALNGGLGIGSGYGGYSGYSGYGHGYGLSAASTYSLGHGIAAPAYSHGYSTPIVSQYTQHNAPLYPSVYRLGYYGGLGHNIGHGIGSGYGIGAGYNNGYYGHGW